MLGACTHLPGGFSEKMVALETRLLSSANFAVPLVRRNPGTSDHRISVGRDPSSHIVLKHRSVSSLQAWVEAGDGAFCVTEHERHVPEQPQNPAESHDQCVPR
jgi:hypothetical protein